MNAPVPAVHAWRDNGALIADVARLGWLRDQPTLDITYGLGTFWRDWQPSTLIRCDLDPTKGRDLVADARRLPFGDRAIPQVVFDPPYKLNGRPDEAVDHRFGVHARTSAGDRLDLIEQGTVEAARICAGALLVKCQDQVNGGRVRWQTDLVTRAAERAGMAKVDRFDLIGRARPQPPGRRQVTAFGRGSTLLVFSRRGRS